EEYPRERCIHELFEEQVRARPDAVALSCEEEVLTYRQLDERAEAVSRALRERDVGPESLVGICIERSVEMVAGLLGILKAGGAYVPLDPSFPKERIAVMLEDSKPGVLLSDSSLRGFLPDIGAEVTCVDRLPEPEPSRERKASE